jgi:histidinol dehydrogenase
MKFIEFTSKDQIKDLTLRPSIEESNLEELVSEIFSNVQSHGDKAIKEYSLRFDQVKMNDLRVDPYEIDEAFDLVSDELKNAITQAYKNIYLFHENQREKSVKIETMPGVFCWRKSVGIEKVGIYIPGGSAPLFSTVLMLAIPAQIAKCKEIILCSPPDRNGKIHPAILFAAKLCGISSVFKVGGIQAIAAMTFGTETIPSVYKLFGPGNQYVTAAKLYAQKYKVSIDMPAGPSEVMVVCDEFANASFVSADLLAQAEHGEDSQVVLLSTSKVKIDEIMLQIDEQTASLPRKTQILGAIKNSVAILCEKENLIEIINEYAPEHLILNTSFNEDLIEEVVNAGSIFIGEYTPESAGDYASGTNHTLPTNSYAKNYSGVSLDSFVKKITYQEITAKGLQNIGNTVEIMAEAEGLLAHKNAISIRLKQLK